MHGLNKQQRVAFVVQRAAMDIDGGAEFLCLELARRLAGHIDIDVLATRAKNYITWQDHYLPDEQIDGYAANSRVNVRRYPVDQTRDIESFNQLCAAYEPHAETLTDTQAQHWLDTQGPRCSALTQYLTAHIDDYDYIVFFTYLYATTHDNLRVVAQLAPHKAIFVPFAHLEWPLKMPIWQRIFDCANYTIFSTPEERNLLAERFGKDRPGEVIASSTAQPEGVSADRARAMLKKRFQLNGEFLLCLGRVDQAKGIGELVALYRASQQRAAAAGRVNDLPALIFAGRAYMSLPVGNGIYELGFIDEATKWDVLAACQALVTASRMESLSIVTLEAFASRKPVLVSKHCPVLAGHAQRSGGGLTFSDLNDFYEALMLLREPLVASELGRRGHAYFEGEFTWPHVVDNWLGVLQAQPQ